MYNDRLTYSCFNLGFSISDILSIVVLFYPIDFDLGIEDWARSPLVNSLLFSWLLNKTVLTHAENVSLSAIHFAVVDICKMEPFSDKSIHSWLFHQCLPLCHEQFEKWDGICQDWHLISCQFLMDSMWHLRELLYSYNCNIAIVKEQQVLHPRSPQSFEACSTQLK